MVDSSGLIAQWSCLLVGSPETDERVEDLFEDFANELNKLSNEGFSFRLYEAHTHPYNGRAFFLPPAAYFPLKEFRYRWRFRDCAAPLGMNAFPVPEFEEEELVSLAC